MSRVFMFETVFHFSCMVWFSGSSYLIEKQNLIVVLVGCNVMLWDDVQFSIYLRFIVFTITWLLNKKMYRERLSSFVKLKISVCADKTTAVIVYSMCSVHAYVDQLTNKRLHFMLFATEFACVQQQRLSISANPHSITWSQMASNGKNFYNFLSS